jgi:hypothetical protein
MPLPCLVDLKERESIDSKFKSYWPTPGNFDFSAPGSILTDCPIEIEG